MYDRSRAFVLAIYGLYAISLKLNPLPDLLFFSLTGPWRNRLLPADDSECAILLDTTHVTPLSGHVWLACGGGCGLPRIGYIRAKSA